MAASFVDKDFLQQRLRERVRRYLPGSVRRYSWRCVTRAPGVRNELLGLVMDAAPFTGKLVDIWEDGSLVLRKGREATLYVVAGDALPPHTAGLGDEITVTPYARRRFSGERCDAPQVQERQSPGGETYRVSSVILGGHDAGMPVRAERCPYLRDLLEQLQSLPATDGFRRIEHVLVDANASNVRLVDPDDADLFRTPPAFLCEVRTQKFSGTLAIVYDRGIDYYKVERRCGDTVVDARTEVAFTELAEVIEDFIDDGAWRLARVDVRRSAVRPNVRAVA